jgi:hypothetical protein
MKRSLSAALASSLIVAMIIATPAHAALFAFSAHTFTSCSTSGPTGPSVTACRTAYSTPWDENSSNYTVSSGIQYWTVPATGRYYIDAYGAGGGGNLGGGGARIADTFALTEGEVIRILVGQTPSTSSANANAGGGGTFVIRSPFNSNASILVIAGGGGGTESGLVQNSVAHASISTSGNSGSGTVSTTGSGAGGTNGGGGGTASAENGGGGGGGFLADGTRNTYWDNSGGYAFVNGGAGAPAGATYAPYSIAGGFGGGGAAAGKGAGGGAGGGGGYSGGGGADNAGGASGGGGGSHYSNGLNINRITTVDAVAENTNGYVTITQLAPPTVSLTVAGSVIQVTKGQTIILSAAIDQSGILTFYADGKRIAGCISLNASVGTKTCSWKPAIQKAVKITANLSQSGSIVATSTLSVSVKKRTGTR